MNQLWYKIYVFNKNLGVLKLSNQHLVKVNVELLQEW